MDINKIRNDLNTIITKICTSGSQILDYDLVKNLKTICKKNELSIEICYELLLNELKQVHSERRYSSFQLIDCLFDRSHKFRELVLDDFQLITELVLGIKNENPLPPPKKAAMALQKLSTLTIKNWHQKYAQTYKILDLGYSYLKTCKKIDFVSLCHQSEAERRHNELEIQRKEIIINTQVLNCIEELNDKEFDLNDCLIQINRCFDLLIPKPDDLFNEENAFKQRRENLQQFITNINDLNSQPINNRKCEIINNNCFGDDDCNSNSDADDDDEFEEVKIPNYDDSDIELRYLGFLNDRSSQFTRNYELNINVNIKQNEDNGILIEILKDLYKEIKFSYLTKINNWIQVFSLTKNSTEYLKKAIDFKNSIQKCMLRLEELKIPIDVNETKSNGTDQKKINVGKMQADYKNDNDNNSAYFDLNCIEIGLTLSSKVDADHRWFGVSDPSNSIQQTHEVPVLAKKFFIGDFEPVKWKCRTPIGNGKLCERMDRYKCPFHGKVVGRDSKSGKITNQDDEIEWSKNKAQDARATLSGDNYSPFGDLSLISDIEAATGKELKLNRNYNRKRKNKKLGNLTDLNKIKTDSKTKLKKKLFNSKKLHKIGTILDNIEKSYNCSKFHHNFNYSLKQ